VSTDRQVTEDMTPAEYVQIRRLLRAFLVLCFVVAAGFAVSFVVAHTFTSFAATLAALFAAYCVDGPLDALCKEGTPS
jgi:hypothetical protein